MNIQRREENGIPVLALQGRLDHASADALHAAAMEYVAEGCKSLVVDMAGVDFIASVGIRSLIRPSQGISINGGKLVIANLSPKLADFFRLTGLDQMFSVHGTVEEAVAALKK